MAFTILESATGGTLTYQWQNSTVDCMTGFSDITGAVQEMYNPPGLLDTTYYRLIMNSINSTFASDLCADTSTCVTVIVYPELACVITPIEISSCNNETAGELMVTAMSGTSGYTYLWSTTETTTTISSLGAGTYSVTVTDANGCTTTCQAVLDPPQDCCPDPNCFNMTFARN